MAVVLSMPDDQIRRVRAYTCASLAEVEAPDFFAEITAEASFCGVHDRYLEEYVIVRLHLQPLKRNYKIADAILPPPCCEIKDSSIHGKGVFALRNIDAGEYLTLYPADAVGFQPKEWLQDRVRAHQQIIVGDVDLSSAQHYLLKIKLDDEGFVGAVGDRRKCDNPHYLGHMINDACKLTNPESATIYQRVSRLRENCKDAQNLNIMAATRNIQAGEELFYSYGVDYWLHRV